MIIQHLHEGWRLQAVSGPIPDNIVRATVPAVVPGSVHTDLMSAGLIDDPYLACNETEVAWMHRTSWRYDTTFTSTAVTGDERLDLVFEGLDTVARIEVNGVHVADTANQHRSFRFDVAGLIQDGENTLTVIFSSALEFAEQIEAQIGTWPRDYPHPMNAVRKMAASFGWDWGPDLQTAGIWRPVRLERWSSARLDQVRPLVTLGDDGIGNVAVHVDLEGSDGDTALTGLTLTATLTGEAAGHGQETATKTPVLATTSVALEAGAGTGLAEVSLPDAPVWWPAGYGAQPLVGLTVTLTGPGDVVLSTYERRIGFRTVEIDMTPDEHGIPFTFVINGKPIFIKGANWIPNDHLLTRITREQLVERVDQAVDANMNMLRVWGGGIYESEDFYDVCDERGILVWQDFLLACASYSEDEPLWAEFEAEARENVARLTPHASLVLWNGGNENLWGFLDWNWKPALDGRAWGLGYYTKLFPEIVAELDPTRPYIAGSPFSPGFTEELESGDSRVHPNDPDHGPSHSWKVWNQLDYTAYRDEIPRFCSEFGFQGPPTWTTLTRAVPEHALHKESPEFLIHQKAGNGNAKLDFGLSGHLTIPDDFEQWHWLTQLNQARAVQFGIEHHRSYWPRTAGSIVWQLNDCWPVTSWAAVDGDGRPKPLLYALRHVYEPRLLTVQPRGEQQAVVIVNDHDGAWVGSLELERVALNGAVLESSRQDVNVAPRSVETALIPDGLIPADGALEMLVVRLGEIRKVHSDIPWEQLPAGALNVQITSAPDGYDVTVGSTGYVQDLTLVADRAAADAVVDDALITLLPGEEHTFRVRTAQQIDNEALAATVRSATHLGA